MLVPVLERDGLLGDVRFLQVVLLSTGWFVVDSAVWEGRGLGLGRWCGGGHVERDCVVRTVDVQDKPPSVGVGIPRTLKGCVGWKRLWFGSEEKVDTNNQTSGRRKKIPEGPEIYYHSRFKQQRLVGNSGCGRGEWNRGGVELPKSDNGPGPVPWKSCAGFVCFRFVGGSERGRCCITFFPADTHRDDFRARTVPYRFYSLTAAVQVAKGRRGPGIQRQTGDMRMQMLTAHSLFYSLPGWHWCDT